MKEGSAPTLEHLRDASQQLVMITGDAALTACHVAKLTHTVERDVLILGHVDVSSDAGASASEVAPRRERSDSVDSQVRLANRGGGARIRQQLLSGQPTASSCTASGVATAVVVVVDMVGRRLPRTARGACRMP